MVVVDLPLKITERRVQYWLLTRKNPMVLGMVDATGESFLEMMMVERGASQHTVDAYRRDLDDYQTYLSRRNGEDGQC